MINSSVYKLKKKLILLEGKSEGSELFASRDSHAQLFSTAIAYIVTTIEQVC